MTSDEADGCASRPGGEVMTRDEARKLVPGVYRFRFDNGMQSVGVVGALWFFTVKAPNDLDWENVVSAELIATDEPEPAPPGKTVRVRVLVATWADGEYHAFCASSMGETGTLREMSDAVIPGYRATWIDADVPLPDEPAVVAVRAVK